MSTQTITINYETGYVETNEDRAAMVRPFVMAYRQAFFGPSHENEPMAKILGDLIANLLHLADRTPDEDDPTEMTGSERVLNRADFHYTAEVDEAADRPDVPA